jgi:hypothetical protein
MADNPDTCFKLFARRLDKFASKYNLQVEKYRHGMAVWNLFFQHPLGGCGRVDVGVNGEEVHLLQWWTVDDYERLRRKSKSTRWEKLCNPADCLEEKLLESISEILAWQLSELKDLGGIAPGPWCNDPAKRPRYPVVKM